MIQQNVLDKFKELFGADGDIRVYFAPGRVNLIGEHTDYNGGHVFPCALTIGTYMAARKRDDRKLRFYSAGRSSFYTIAACAATSLLVFQTCLNIFGAVDILPFTGVTLPFVSNGGSSMLSAWGMLAFLKATDTRQNASFAVRLPSRRELRGEE